MDWVYVGCDISGLGYFAIGLRVVGGLGLLAGV